MKKTAIQIAIENVDQCLNLEDVKGMLGILLEMEKQQIIESYRDGRTHQQQIKVSRFYNQMAKDYYNETFKSK